MNKTINALKKALISDNWAEAGGEIESAAPCSLQQIADMPLVPAHVLKGTDATATFTEADYQRLTIHLSTLVTLPIKHLRVLERYHRVFLVSYVPYGQLDPVLPITAVPLGHAHNDSYRLLSNKIHLWDPEGDMKYEMSYHQDWYKAAILHANYCAAAAVECLRPDEAAYYATQLMYSVARPARKYEHF